MTEILIGTGVIALLVVGLAFGLVAARSRLMPQESVPVRLNGSHKLVAQRGDKLLSVLQGQGIGVPAGCGGKGTCGLCRVTVGGAGAGAPLASEKALLSAAERRQGLRLACQVALRGPVEVTVPAEVLSAESFDCTVRSNTMLAPLIRELVLDLPEGQRFDFRAGGFAQLTAPAHDLRFATLAVSEQFGPAWDRAGWRRLRSVTSGPVTRAYSIASRPQDRGQIVFNIRLAVPPAGQEAEVPPGQVSSYLFGLRPGDRLAVSGPFGEFHARPTKAEMIFVGGGVGMAPLRAILHEQIGSGRQMRYFYGARSRADLFYVEELDALAARNPQFSWQAVLSDPAPGDRWTGAVGFVHEAVRAHLARHPAPEECEYYLCGPPVMIAAVKAMLAAQGVEPDHILADDFGV